MKGALIQAILSGGLSKIIEDRFIQLKASKL